MTIAKFQKTILDWYKNNRRDLPWRKTRDPYKILVSEVMLQQTQITRVLPKYKEFLEEFPTLEALARASDKKLLKVWSGLGYWRRAKYLKEAAKEIIKKARTADLTRRVGPRAKRGVKREEKTQFERFFPQNPKQLETLPGVGHYTARALACFAFTNKEAFIDTNIRRVYLHFFFGKGKKIADKEILVIAQKAIDALPKEITPREWHYALFDYGAVMLKDKAINKRSQHYAKQSKFDGSFRSYRTKIVRFLLSHSRNSVSYKELESFLRHELQKNKSPYVPNEILNTLLKDKLIKRTKDHYSI